MPDTTTLQEARDLVAAVVVDDVTDTEADDDLRDVGLDSIRLMSLLSGLRATGIAVGFEDVAGDPTLRGLAAAIERARA